MPYENTVHIKVKFDRKVAFRVYDELNGEIIEDSDGNLYTEIEVPNDYNLYNYIFFFRRWSRSIRAKRDTNAD